MSFYKALLRNVKLLKLVNYETTVTLKAMLEAIDTGRPFSIGWRTCNKTKHTGGEYIFLENVVKHSHQTKAQRKLQLAAGNAPLVRRNPNHFENSTRNIRRLDNGDIITIHIRLICRFNNKQLM